MGLYDDLKKSLLEAIAMEKGEIPLAEKKDMPAPTIAVPDHKKKGEKS